MAFQKENQLWKKRSKHGRDALFADAQLLWEQAVKYFEWCDDNPLYESDHMVVNKSLKEIDKPLKRPYTLQGLCIYLGCGSTWWRDFKKNPKTYIGDFPSVMEQIEEVIYEQKFAGAAVGQFNSNIIARDLGLAEKKEIQGNLGVIEEKITFE